jgi:putative ABC transport system ATP-binding protein
VLVVEGLKHGFKGRVDADDTVLDIGRLTVGAGALTVITGPSGSGKTTLLYALSGLLKATRGSIVWGETDIAGLGEGARDRWRRRNAGFVFQNFHLIEEMSAMMNVTVAAYFDGLSNARVRQRAHDLLTGFGVPDTSRSVASFSRGEQQRVALARALVFAPPIIFADEPTASLDADNAARLATQLGSLAREEGRTVLAVSHDVALIEAADEIIRLEHGRISGPVAAGVAA